MSEYGAYNDPTTVAPAGWEQFPSDFVKQNFWPAFAKAFLTTYIGHTSGDVFEFGTYKGYTARILAELIRDFNLQETYLRLFDSFEGLPEITSQVDKTSPEVAVDKVWYRGQMALETGIEHSIRHHLSKIIPEQRVVITKGFFENVLPGKLRGLKARIVHIDCDLFSSSVTVLENLLQQDVIQDGTILLFDDYSCSRASPYHGQRRALEVAFERQNRFFFSSYFNYAGGSWAFFCHERQG